MAQSISKSQADLLAEGFLDSLGSNRDTSDLKLNATMSTLVQLAGELIDTANENLHNGGHVSSGELIDSHKVRDPRFEGQEIVLDVEANFYYQFVNKGVSGTKSGSGLYSFKSDFPSREMVKSIQAWITRGKMSSFNVKRSVSNQEVKSKRISDYDKAYAVARSIKMKGIRATGYFDRAITSIEQLTANELGKSFRVDIIDSLPDNLSDGTNNKK